MHCLFYNDKAIRKTLKQRLNRLRIALNNGKRMLNETIKWRRESSILVKRKSSQHAPVSILFYVLKSTPAFEKSFFEGTEVAGIQINLRTTLIKERSSFWILLPFQKERCSATRYKRGILLYSVITIIDLASRFSPCPFELYLLIDKPVMISPNRLEIRYAHLWGGNCWNLKLLV